ncbi:O-antigen ligase family protein [Novosphingobium subterraneum]|uniref:O-antigen ligase family protein n=1 Tax=Novosphingobium subterraneum TaxID=48936 RepID=UPI003D007A70
MSQGKQYGGPTLAAYHQVGWRSRRRLFLLGLLALISFAYGAIFALTQTYFLMQLSVPFVGLALLIIWCLPETGQAPERLLEGLFAAFLIALLCWPDYLAVAIPGLPWFTALRLVAVPLAIVLLISLSQSPSFRADMARPLKASPITWRLVVLFSLLALVSVPLSSDPSGSTSKFIVAMLYWVMIFFVSAWVFQRPGRATFLAFALWMILVGVCAIGLWEQRLQSVPWAGHIPSFLKIEDPAVERILSAKSRAASKLYRVQSKFTTPLGLAEFLAYATPFVLHIALTTQRFIVRIAALATFPLIWATIVGTDSRLGMVGFFMTFMLYLIAWAALRWRRSTKSLFGPATVLAYPVIFVAFILSTFFVGRLRALIWGGGAQSASTESRKIQIASGMPKVWGRPWGHGIGQGAETLGFRNADGVLTIDNYYLGIALELGIIGFVVFYAIFIGASLRAIRVSLRQFDSDTAIIFPLVIALINFVIIKSIFSQLENHPLVFAFLGATLALVFLISNKDQVTSMSPTENSTHA